MSYGWRVHGLLVILLTTFTPAVVRGQSDGATIDPASGLPAPWGLGLTLYNQRQPYLITSLEVGLPGVDPAALEGLDVDHQMTTAHLKLDYWVLPFLNVFATFGQIEGTTAVHLNELDLGLPIPLDDLVVDYDGWVYGGGLTLTGGTDSYFGSLTYDFNRSDLDLTDSSVESHVLTPRAGYHNSFAAAYVGGMYQLVDEQHRGVATIPLLGSFPFDVALEEEEPWNYLVGVTAGLGGHWVLTLEGFFGTRDAALVTLDYRWGRRTP